MSKPFANPQTYQEIQYKASRGKKPVSRQKSRHTPTPFSSRKLPKTLLFTEGETSSTCEGGGCWGPAAAEKDPQAPRGANRQPPQEAERKPRGSKLRDSSAPQQEHTAGRPRATAGCRRFGLAPTRRAGVTNMGTTAPRPTQTKELQAKAPEAAVTAPSLTSWGGDRYHTHEPTGERSHQRNKGQKRAS